MKRYLSFFLFVILFTFSSYIISCDFFGDNITIYNNSSYQVSFKFASVNSYTHTLDAGKNDKYYAHSTSLAFYTSNPPRVNYKGISSTEGEFVNTIPLNIEVRNILNFSVSIYEKNNFMETVTLAPMETKLFTDVIYTSTPNFLTTPSSRTSFTVDRKQNIIYVIVY